MSRIGRMPIPIPDGVKIDINDSLVKVTGPKGCITKRLPSEMDLSVVEDKLVVSIPTTTKQSSALSGLTRSLLASMVAGVSKGFEKSLELVGIGYRAELQGTVLQLMLGYSHPIRFELPPGITASVEKQTKITFAGIDKELVGETAAVVRDFRKPEPYKGKGIKYSDEIIRRKIGKKGIK